MFSLLISSGEKWWTQLLRQQDQRLSRFSIGLLGCLSHIVSAYAYKARIQRAGKRSEFPGWVVISVGNLVWGGTGKTPMVEYLLRHIQSRGGCAVVASRGANSDELRQLQHKFPWVGQAIGADRKLALAELIQNLEKGKQKTANNDSRTFKWAVLDDGFQHHRLGRSLDVVMINCWEPFGIGGCLNESKKRYGFVIPQGSLREPVSALSDANVIVLHHANHVTESQLKIIKEMIHKAIDSSPFPETKSSLMDKKFDKSYPLIIETVYDWSHFTVHSSNVDHLPKKPRMTGLSHGNNHKTYSLFKNNNPHETVTMEIDAIRLYHRVLVICGLGDLQAYRKQWEELHPCIKWHTLGDHQSLSLSERLSLIQDILYEKQQSKDADSSLAIALSEKDFFRQSDDYLEIAAKSGVSIWVISGHLRVVSGEPAFLKLLETIGGSR